MKRILTNTALIGFLFFMAGCEDFLEEQPKDLLTSDGFYKNKEQATFAINAAYDGMQHLTYYGFNYPMILNISGADALKGGFGGGDRAEYLEHQNYDITSANHRNRQFYQAAWGSVNRANSVLDNVGAMEVTDDFTQADKDIILAQAKFLRALHYYNLTLDYGGLPIYTEVPSASSEPLPRASQEDTWAFIIQDLQEAANTLPDSFDSANVGRATKGAAHAMLARISAFRGDWAGVLNYTNLVIGSPAGYDLAATYESNFDGSGNNNSESIFEIQYTVGSASVSIWSSETGDWNSNGFSKFSAPQGHGGGWGFMSPTEDLVSDYESGDLRLGQTVYQPGDTIGDEIFDPESTGHQGNAGPYGLKKYTQLDLGNEGGPINYKIIRFGEILLLRAEAENELNGPTDAALEPLNRIRLRAGLPEINDINNPGLDQATLRDIILHERRIELAFEGIRWHDLKERGRALEFLGSRGYTDADALFLFHPDEIALTGWEQN